jgi:hypothetical protein
MFKTTRAKVIGLSLVGVMALGGAIYATTSLTVGGASASPAIAQATQTATDSQLRSTILDMLRDRMGLTGPDAEKFADQMISRMQNAGAGFDLQAMVDRCARFGDANNANANGRGMMNGSGSVNGRGMMNGSGWANGVTTPSTGASNPGGATPGRPDPQDSSSGFPRGGMMGSGMMGGAGLR